MAESFVNIQGGYLVEDGIPVPGYSKEMEERYWPHAERLRAGQSMCLPGEARLARWPEEYFTQVQDTGALRVWRIR